jgi:hypothetical protein
MTRRRVTSLRVLLALLIALGAFAGCERGSKSSNRVTGDLGTVGGGEDNEVGGYATVGGGSHDTAGAWHSTVAGGSRSRPGTMRARTHPSGTSARRPRVSALPLG